MFTLDVAIVGNAAQNSSGGMIRPALRAICGLTLIAALLCLGLWFAVPNPLVHVVRWPISPVLLDKDNNLIHARLSSASEWCLPIPLSEMGTWLPKLLVTVEDKRFYDHIGIDFLALGRAVGQNIVQGRVVSGASTITSQLVRLSYPRTRTMRAKLLEFIGAVKLESHLTKNEILEYYLNKAPFGGPIRGVEAAARLYFGKRAKELSLGEAALLVGLLKGPTAYRPDRNPKASLERRQNIIQKAATTLHIPEETTALALQEPLPTFQAAMPSRYRHFADIAFATLTAAGNETMGLYGTDPEAHYGATLGIKERLELRSMARHNPENMGGIVRSTLDPHVQQLLEQSLATQLRFAPNNVTAAGIVIDNATASIIAYVGNSRFDPAKDSEWVDCALASRSPGSTLKPFLYLSAMERGLIIPASLLADTPLRFKGDPPRNFDRRFRGPVTVHTALADSLNTPAVRIFRMLGTQNTLYHLRNIGFSLQKPKDTYGDSLALGAGEATLVELARAYATLANFGFDRPLTVNRPLTATLSNSFIPSPENSTAPSLIQESPVAPPRAITIPLSSSIAASAENRQGQQLYSRDAAFLISKILCDPSRLPFIEQLTQVRENAPVAFKTGTSHGLRDAWTAAYTPTHTIVVWFGKASGRQDNHLTGISIATPAALRVIREIFARAISSKELQLRPNWAPALAKDEDSGLLWYAPPAGIKKVRVCALSGAAPSAFCPSTRLAWCIASVWRTVPCSMHIKEDNEIRTVWPPDLEDWTRRRFAAEDRSREVQIVSPLAHVRYLITPGISTQPIALRAEGASYPVHWFIDGEFFGKQNQAESPLEWFPPPGKHTLSLLDSQERTSTSQTEIIDLAAQMKETPLF